MSEQKEELSAIETIIEDNEQEPVTLQALAKLDSGQGLERMNTAIDILTNVRRASIAITDPEDWLLFRRPDGRVTAYLSDDGCYRIEPIWRISVMPPGDADKFTFEEIKDAEDFAFVVSGNGYCKLTGASAIGVEGVRRSDEDFVREKKGIQKKIEVRKAAFANLHGGIVRKLTGLKNLALTELDSVWSAQGKNKSSAHCAQGRGFGGKSARYGSGEATTGETPKCPKCQGPMKLITPKPGASWSAFWGCGQGKDKCKGSIQDTDWQIQLAKRPLKEEAEQNTTEREPGDDPPAANGETLPQKKNRLLELLRSKDKLPESRRSELTKAITSAKKVEDLIDVEAALNE